MSTLPFLHASASWLPALMLLIAMSTQAATYVNQTRLIINEQDREVTFSVINEGDAPALIQIWSDRDNLLDQPEEIKMPFVILPPVFRLEGKSSRAVRIQALGNTSEMSKSQESLFWLNVLEVPPKASSPGTSSVIQMAFRTRIKLYFRPAAIASATLQEGVKRLQFSQIRCGADTCLRLTSVSPLHITLLDVTFDKGNVIHALPNDGMITPFSTLDIPLPAKDGSGQLQALTWIDDYGVAHHFTR